MQNSLNVLRVGMLVALLFAPAQAHAQIRASELGTMAQTIDGTRIVVQYSRPRARGRDTLFGIGDRSWGALWTPGANWATTIDVSQAVTINSASIPKGKYSMWMQLRSDTAWTLVLDPDFHRFHEDRPRPNAAQIRIPVVISAAPFTDVLTWSMPALRIDGGTLEFRWERARAAFDIGVSPSLATTLPAGDAAAYVGVYGYTEFEDGKPVKSSTLTVTYADGTLKGQFDPEDQYFRTFALIRIAPDWFAPGIYDKSGRIYEVLRPDETWEFARKAGKVVSLVVRLEDDELYARAIRKP